MTIGQIKAQNTDTLWLQKIDLTRVIQSWDYPKVRIQFLISMDNVTWTDLGQFDFNNLLSGEQNFTMPPSSMGRYFKFVGLAGQPGNDQYMALGEISAYGF